MPGVSSNIMFVSVKLLETHSRGIMCLGEWMVPMVGQKVSKDVRAKVVAKDELKHAETIRIGNDWEMSPSPSTYKMVPGCFRFVGCHSLMV